MQELKLSLGPVLESRGGTDPLVPLGVFSSFFLVELNLGFDFLSGSNQNWTEILKNNPF
jgi:hypothetical protein